MTAVEVITSKEKRRYWTRAEKCAGFGAERARRQRIWRGASRRRQHQPIVSMATPACRPAAQGRRSAV